MIETIFIQGRGYEVTVAIDVKSDRRKFIADADKLRASLVKAIDQVIAKANAE
jgi:hypothetical protein